MAQMTSLIHLVVADAGKSLPAKLANVGLGPKKRPKLEPKIEAVKTLPAAGEIEAEFDDQVSTTDKFILIV